jgi:diguanylate cyclase (GGDEF)-like protein
MYVQTVHSMLMILVSMGLLIHDSVKSEDKQWGKIRLIIAASVFAVVGLVLMQTKPFHLSIDYMALFLPVTCVLVIIAIARYDLLETKAMARSKVFEYSTNAILLVNRRHRILDYNNRAKQLFASVNIRMDNGYIATLFEEYPEVVSGLEKDEQNIVWLRGRYYEISTMSIDNEKTTRGWVKMIRDVTKLYQLNEELNTQALTDELSSLGNRRAFIQTANEWVSQAWRNGRMLHLAMLDLDNFKNVNDQYGHPAGDAMIHDFGRMLKEHFGTDSVVARLGGEEFAVLQAGLTDDEMMRKLDAFLTDTARREFSYQGIRFHVTVSIGLTQRQLGQGLDSMMRKADKALYQSKDRGRNCITVS